MHNLGISILRINILFPRNYKILILIKPRLPCSDYSNVKDIKRFIFEIFEEDSNNI